MAAVDAHADGLVIAMKAYAIGTRRGRAGIRNARWMLNHDALRSGSALQRKRDASAMAPRRSDGGSAAAIDVLIAAPRVQRKKTELIVAAAVTAPTA